VHLLDDGFQHFALARNLDVLVTSIGEIPSGRVLPNGRLREPADAAARAHVLVVMGATAGAAAAEAWTLGVSLSCAAARAIGAPRRVDRVGSDRDASGDRVGRDCDGTLPDAPVAAICGIANPERFFDDLRAAGWNVVAHRAFPDHHSFTARDIAELERLVTASSAEGALTTEKDAVRFEALGALPFRLFAVPMRVQFDPPDVLFDSVAEVLAASASPSRDSARHVLSRAEGRAPGQGEPRGWG
jgi:tetraacyldisaccharide 4'-kinase